MPVKKESRVKPTTVSSRAKRGDPPRTGKIASSLVSLVPRNDKRGTTRVNLSVPVYSLAGEADGSLDLPKEIFGQKINKQLLAQAMRVYLTNQKIQPGFTKTRGEVAGSTVKIYRQKGTGRARHGSIRAPIFVGGGIVFGPKPRKTRLDLPQKMKKAALVSALSAKTADKQITILSDLEKATGKTKEMASLVNKLFAAGSPLLTAESKQSKAKSLLIVTDGSQHNMVRAVRNIPRVNVLPVNLINAYEILRHKLLLITKGAIEKIAKRGSS